MQRTAEGKKERREEKRTKRRIKKDTEDPKTNNRGERGRQKTPKKGAAE